MVRFNWLGTTRCVLVAAALLGESAAGAQATARVSRLFGTGVAVGEGADFAQPLSIALFADGSLAVLDWGRFDLTRLSPDGRVVWRAGRRGGGPGEFQVPHRLLVLPDQSLLVFDAGKAGIARFSSAGQYLGELLPDMRVTVYAVAALPSGNIAVTGYTTDPRGRNAAIHLFSPRMQHLRSFGPLIASAEPRVVRGYGAGSLDVNADGTFQHTRLYPYEVRTYTELGQERRLVRIEGELGRPEDYFVVRVENGRTNTSVNNSIPRALPARALPDGTLLGGRAAGKNYQLELVAPSGTVIDRMARPSSWEGIAVVDRARRVFWVTGTDEDVPVLWRVPFGPGLP